jgi:hypothetical protein
MLEVHGLSQQGRGLDPSQASEQGEHEEQVLLQRAQ